MKWFNGEHRKNGAPDWALVILDMQTIIILQNEAILAKLEQRPSKLSPQDQAKVDEIFAIEDSDRKKIDAALK